jgi:cytochrome subunit of sulfide dehydrogenase
MRRLSLYLQATICRCRRLEPIVIVIVIVIVIAVAVADAGAHRGPRSGKPLHPHTATLATLIRLWLRVHRRHGTVRVPATDNTIPTENETMHFPHKLHLRATLVALLLVAGAAAHGQSSAVLHTRALAATCANCHGTDGKAVQGEAMVPLAGLSKDHIVTQMQAFREGKRPATVMHQITKGYTNEQIESIAAYFAARK